MTYRDHKDAKIAKLEAEVRRLKDAQRRFQKKKSYSIEQEENTEYLETAMKSALHRGNSRSKKIVPMHKLYEHQYTSKEAKDALKKKIEEDFYGIVLGVSPKPKGHR